MASTWQPLLFETCEKGISSAVEPELLADTQFAWGANLDVRGGKPKTRPNFELRLNLPNGLFQGADYFGVQNGMMVVSIRGHLYRIRVNNRSFAHEEIGLEFVNSGVLKQVWMCQTVETLVIQDGQSNAILYDGSTAVRATGTQVPRGRMMAYGNGRLWLALNAKELVAGDIRTRAPGSELNFTESNYFTGGGSLFFPRGITGLSFIPVTGQADYGALLAFGLDYSKAIRADVTQRDQWASIPGFEQSLLNSVGSAGQWPIVSVNQDLYWRDSNGGIRSIRNSLADEQGPGSSPVSREVSRLTDYDSQRLMPWCSGVYHDNRLLMTSSPFLLQTGAVGWKNLISLDFAPLSTMQGKAQPVYNGQWNGLNFVKLVSGSFQGKNRAFAFTTDSEGNNQLWEFGTGNRADMTGLCDSPVAITPNPITAYLEYPRRNFGVAKHRKRLERCDVWLSSVNGPIELKVYWRADNSQKWLQWDEGTACANTTDASTEAPHVWKNLLPQERPQFKTFTIPENINAITGYAAQVGFEFQIRLVWTGRLKVHRMMTYGTLLEDPDYALREEFVDDCLTNDVSGNEVPYVIPPNGCPDLGVTQGETSIPNAGAFDYGVANGDLDVTFTIHNTGNGVLSIGHVTVTDGTGVTGDFEVISQPDPQIPLEGSSDFVVRMKGTPPGAKFGVVVIPNNVVGENPFVFDVTGYVANPSLSTTYRSKGAPVSEGGGGVQSYTLCGFDEFIPSTPPRKYKAAIYGGTLFGIVYFNTSECEDPTGASFSISLSGVAQYAGEPCGLISTGTVTVVETPGGTTTGPISTATPFASGCFGEAVTTRLTTTEIGNDACCNSSETLKQRHTGGRTIGLGDEDVPHDAVERHNTTIGFDPTAATVAYIKPRVSGFSAEYVSVDAKYEFTGLPAGQSFLLHITYGRRVYGTSGPFLTYATEDVPFTTTGGTEFTDWIPLPNESGFETKVLNATAFPA